MLYYGDGSLTSDEQRARNTFNLEFDNMPEYRKRIQIVRKIKYLEKRMDNYYDDSEKEIAKKKIKFI